MRACISASFVAQSQPQHPLPPDEPEEEPPPGTEPPGTEPPSGTEPPPEDEDEEPPPEDDDEEPATELLPAVESDAPVLPEASEAEADAEAVPLAPFLLPGLSHCWPPG